MPRLSSPARSDWCRFGRHCHELRADSEVHLLLVDGISKPIIYSIYETLGLTAGVFILYKYTHARTRHSPFLYLVSLPLPFVFCVVMLALHTSVLKVKIDTIVF